MRRRVAAAAGAVAATLAFVPAASAGPPFQDARYDVFPVRVGEPRPGEYRPGQFVKLKGVGRNVSEFGGGLKTKSALWLVPAGGGAARPFTWVKSFTPRVGVQDNFDFLTLGRVPNAPPGRYRVRTCLNSPRFHPEPDYGNNCLTATQIISVIRDSIFVSPIFSVAIRYVSFGFVEVGEDSGVRKILFRNRGADGLSVRYTIAGPGRSDFSSVNSSCAGVSVAAGASCSVGLVFSPRTAGSRAARMVVTGRGAFGSQAPRTTSIELAGEALP